MWHSCVTMCSVIVLVLVVSPRLGGPRPALGDGLLNTDYDLGLSSYSRWPGIIVGDAVAVGGADAPRDVRIHGVPYHWRPDIYPLGLGLLTLPMICL